MKILQKIQKRIKGKNLRIVFPDGHEPNVLKAGAMLVKQGLAIPYFVGYRPTIEQLCKKNRISMDKFEIRDPLYDQNTESFADQYFELRKRKEMTPEKARETVLQSNYFGAMLLRNGLVDGMVSGYNSSTKPFLPAFHIVGTKGERASSYFLMIKNNIEYFFSDCGLVISPSAEELAEIALTTAETAKMFSISPKVAMLSFSTKGSAKHEMVDKVKKATEIAQAKNPSLAIDGEVQFDAAIIPEISKKKKSTLNGKANIFIFPDLNSGNISYKIAERLGGFTALGPLLQGLKKPVNDMSRGASVQDIFNIAGITAFEALYE